MQVAYSAHQWVEIGRIKTLHNETSLTGSRAHIKDRTIHEIISGSYRRLKMPINWKTLNEVPKTFRTLAGGRLSVEQCNLIYNEIAPKYVRELAGGRKDFNYAKARAEFMAMHKKRKIGNSFVWVIKSGNGDIQSAGGGDN